MLAIPQNQFYWNIKFTYYLSLNLWFLSSPHCKKNSASKDLITFKIKLKFNYPLLWGQVPSLLILPEESKVILNSL